MAERAMWFGLLTCALAAVGCGSGGGGSVSGGVNIPGSANRTAPGSGSKPSDWMKGHWRQVHNRFDGKLNDPRPEQEQTHAYFDVANETVRVTREFDSGAIEKKFYTIKSQNKKTGELKLKNDKGSVTLKFVVSQDGVMREINDNFLGEGVEVVEFYYRVGSEVEP